jgi:predicted DNA-binding transcriptional regulator AlpA
MNQQQTSNFDPLLKISDIVRNPKKRGYSLLPVSRSTFLRGVAKGEYPKPVRIAGSQLNYWRLSEIEAVIDPQNEVDHSIGGTV